MYFAFGFANDAKWLLISTINQAIKITNLNTGIIYQHSDI